MTLCTECEENEAVCELTLTDMDSVIMEDAKLCHMCCDHIIEFHPDEKDKPLSIKKQQLNKHTPGPWEAEDIGGGEYEVNSKLHNIATVSTHAPQHETNACLLAAAPDLLQAAIYARDNVCVGSNPVERNAWQYLNDAITKAEQT